MKYFLVKKEKKLRPLYKSPRNRNAVVLCLPLLVSLQSTFCSLPPSAFVRTLSSLCNFSTLTLKSPINPSISSASSTFSMEMDSLPNGSATSPGPSPGPTAAAAPSSKLSHLSESLKLEHQFLRVPFEHYKKTIRANHRVVEREMSSVINGVSEAADSDDMSSDDAVNHLSSLVSRLQGLKRKLEEGSRTEHLQAQRCRARLDHLESADVESLSDWNNTRLNRILVDYMLRMSYYDTAAKLAESRNIQDLVDIDVFQEAKKVIEALQNKEVGPALAWCAENKSRLKKSKSKFEFQLRLQEFIELVRAENNLRAITYAQKYLAPWGTTHMKELQRVFVTVAYKSTTECATYKVTTLMPEAMGLPG
ncbi:hypothetical protein PRUPE_2G222200 [Prunus persica]|uniref:CTLH domain-containing protein n=1 Tax=Prunus persica TaxID=3760 RepID=A0A251QK23_PRUPE|nr:hypothetical protein PRUPE_2G222200 [Prunus persica]